MIDKLRELIEYLSVPAFVFSVSEGEIVANNALVIKNHGLCFLKSCTFKIKNQQHSPGEKFYLRVNRKEPELIFETCLAGNALFQAMMFSENMGLAYEVIPDCQSVSAHGCHCNSFPCSSASKDNFQLTYIYNIGTGRWIFSQPEQLFTLGMVKTKKLSPGFDWRTVIQHEDLPLYDSTFSNAIKHGGNHEIHYRVMCLDGSAIPVAEYCGVTVPENQWPIVIGSIVTTRRSEEAMIRAEKQVLTGRLLGGMIHDFKNLLGGIRNMIEWSINISPDEQVAEALRKTLGYTDQATDLICGTLRLNTNGDSSSPNGDAKIEKISLDRLVYDLEDLISRIIPSSITLSVSVEPGLPCIYGKKSILQDMLLNLCVNARDAMKKKGDQLKVCVTREELMMEHGSRQLYIALSVEDNGCGMSRTEIKKIFDAFYSTKNDGAGLGMWMVRNAVQSFDGKIEVDSEVGCGTVIKVLFPVIEPTSREEMDSDENVEETVPDSVPSPSVNYAETFRNSDKTILYIEDNHLVSSSVISWLESLGFTLYFADNGLDGKALFEKHHQHIDLVIQDFVLPGIKGDELLTFFCGLRPDIPVIVVSAENDEDCTRSLLEKGAAELIRKPFKMDDLLRSLMRVLVG